jgi:hypothetical protein
VTRSVISACVGCICSDLISEAQCGRDDTLLFSEEDSHQISSR